MTRSSLRSRLLGIGQFIGVKRKTLKLNILQSGKSKRVFSRQAFPLFFLNHLPKVRRTILLPLAYKAGVRYIMEGFGKMIVQNFLKNTAHDFRVAKKS